MSWIAPSSPLDLKVSPILKALRSCFQTKQNHTKQSKTIIKNQANHGIHPIKIIKLDKVLDEVLKDSFMGFEWFKSGLISML